VIITIPSESSVWLQVKHLLRSAGLRYYLQSNLFDKNSSELFLEPIPEPEGGELRNGLIVFDGGKKFLPFCSVNEIEEVRQEEIARL